MRIDELINKLNRIREQYGNIKIEIVDIEGNNDDIKEVYPSTFPNGETILFIE